MLLGLLPALHPVMPLVIWPWSCAYLFFSRKSIGRKERTGLLLAIGAGLAVCAALALVIFIRAGDSGAIPPYNIQAGDNVDGKLIHWQFTMTTDSHRRLAPLWWYGYSVGPIALLAIMALMWALPNGPNGPNGPETAGSIAPGRRACFWLLALSGIASLYVYGAWVVHYWRGWLPKPIAMFMPYRFSNLTTLLLVPVTVAAMACAHSVMDDRARRLALLILAGLTYVVGRGFFSDRYPGALYAMWGTLLAMDFYACRKRPWRRWASPAAILVVGAMTLSISGETRQGGNWIPLTTSLLISFLVCSIAFGLSGLIWRRRENRDDGKPAEPQAALWSAARRWPLQIGMGNIALVCACLVASLAALPRSSNQPVFTRLPRWDMISQDDLELKQWLATHGRPNEMILPSVMPPNKAQQKIDHPILMERESLWLMSYMPSLSQALGMMMRDLYGVDYANPDQFNRLCPGGRLDWYSPVWREIWKERKREEWQALGRKYDFRLVLAPIDSSLDLPIAQPGRYWNLYEIP